MAHDTIVEHQTEMAPNTVDNELWDGGKSPMGVRYGKLMMWYFLLSDAFTFAGFLISYGALRFSVPSWPVPDFVFRAAPFGVSNAPLVFVTFMTFVLIVSSVTMVRAVQEGHRENKNGVIFWLLMTLVGGGTFLGSQAFEWNTLISHENVTLDRNPFGSHVASGVYLNADGSESDKTFERKASYLIHLGHGEHEGETGHSAGVPDANGGMNFPHQYVDNQGFVHKKFKVLEGPDAGTIKMEEFGPKAFGALFFFITGFHGFHVFTGLIIISIILINAASGLYVKRKNGYEMVEKIGLYWHFVDLVWVFVFLVFYLL